MPFTEIVENEDRMDETIILRELLALIDKFVKEGYIMPVIRKFNELKETPIDIVGHINCIWVMYPGIFGVIYRWENQREEILVKFVWSLLRDLSVTKVHIRGVNSPYYNRIARGIHELILTCELNRYLSEKVKIRDKESLYVHLLGKYKLPREAFDILYMKIV